MKPSFPVFRSRTLYHPLITSTSSRRSPFWYCASGVLVVVGSARRGVPFCLIFTVAAAAGSASRTQTMNMVRVFFIASS